MRKQRTLDARFLAFALTLAALGCEPPPDFVTRHGVAFHLQGTHACSREQAEAMESEFLARLDAEVALTGRRRAECMAQARVVFEPGLFPCTGEPGRTCAGEQVGGTLRLAALACPYQTAYIHELLHWLQECMDGQVDYDHQAPTWRVVWDQLAASRERCGEAASSAALPGPHGKTPAFPHEEQPAAAGGRRLQPFRLQVQLNSWKGSPSEVHFVSRPSSWTFSPSAPMVAIIQPSMSWQWSFAIPGKPVMRSVVPPGSQAMASIVPAFR